MQSGQDFHDYLKIIKQRYFFFVLPFAVLSAGSFAVALLLPPIYQSSATILIESQKIPKDLVQATVASLADERIQVIGQRTMTRENLMRIVNKFALFSEKSDRLSVTELVDEMRERTRIQRIPLPFQGKQRRRPRAGPTTVAFTVSFEHENPRVTAKVANELVTVILSEDAQTRKTRASDTTKFIRQEAERLEKELVTNENQITEFKRKHRDTLPENLEFRLKLLERAQAELKEIDRQTLAAAQGLSTDQANSPLQQLALLKADLTRKSAIYAKSHPDIISLKRQISAMEKQGSAVPKKLAKNSALENGTAASGSVAADANRRPAGYASAPLAVRTRHDKLEKQVAALQKSVDKTPDAERILKTLGRRYENNKLAFEEMIRKQQHARLGERLEEDTQAEHFEVIEQPIIPEVPIKPDRRKILTLGLFLAFAVGTGSIVATEFFDRSIRSSADITEYMELRPLVSIPYILTRDEVENSKKQFQMFSAGAAAVFVVLLLGIHLLYMPLDIVFYKVLTRFQL